MPDPFPLASHFKRLLKNDERSEQEKKRLANLMSLFAELPPPPDPFHLYPKYNELKDRFVATAGGADFESLEEAFLLLYCHVHGHEAPYTNKERRRVDETGGYWCHAGGISPILKAEPHIEYDTISCDFGAGNGLQGLLFQKLYPHKKTVQIEISSRMIEAGKELQSWLGIPKEKVEWIVGDVIDTSPKGMGFIYLYRPVRPEGEGMKFYSKFASELESSSNNVIIFSIADCLRPFLSSKFEIFYSDGHLTCYRYVKSSG